MNGIKIITKWNRLCLKNPAVGTWNALRNLTGGKALTNQ